MEQDKRRFELISKVLDKAQERSITYDDRMSMFMDLDVASQECDLDLERLLTFDDLNFGHDIYGIRANINRTTKTIDNCFLPRCSS